MSAIQKFIADLLNGFSFQDIPLLLFQLFVAALSSWISALVLRRNQQGPAPVEMALIAAFTALLVAIVKYSIPLSVALVAVFCLFSGRFISPKEGKSGDFSAIIAAGLGLGFGSGHVIMTGIGFVFVILPLMWFYRK